MALSYLTEDFSLEAALHALTAGAMATMIMAMMTMAMMTRASLGHSGRELHADTQTTVAYIMLVGSFLSRVFGETETAYFVSGGLWIVAFEIFCVVYAPILLRKSPR
jgi:uncharacterized protein involved in response to NO